MGDVVNFLVAGVGGQGAVLASDIIAEVGLEAGLDVKKSEIHGMSQRAGSVFSHVRWGQQISAPLFGDGEADFLVSFEIAEALRFQSALRRGGLSIVNEEKIFPVAVAMGLQEYPPDDALSREYARAGQHLLCVDARQVAAELGEVRAANTVLLGILSHFLKPSVEIWEKVLARRVPARAREINMAAFARGRELGAARDMNITLKPT